ncbi:hypothetical protein ASPACDRAFT_1860739 [Aspergillus aculeatus ATCC 16872]|uniref:Uncharacterized protein n=1 Tax=Aspergillus aculeatus (strain ATCC 16872 / CBS 172.66 / WB 5094) TaxID=690307 RepID=A0A1L9WEZ1_ASPA1|nr:uncharacterized protein ASPACDRAFT_1860739 [Aspergillus aculeatus ATCC 16872]OJJ94724.1 hypothetical protein ASPACDRAFT_1860739 [Aspergillus aculeatus ATCC 16872]
MDSMWQAVKTYFGENPIQLHTHCCDLKPPKARNENINFGVEIPEDVMGLFSAIGDTSRPPCTCDGMDALVAHIDAFIRAAPARRPEDYTLHSGKQDQSSEDVCRFAMRDALQWWTVWHGSLEHHKWKHLYLALCTISDDLVIPPQDLADGTFTLLGHSLADILAGLRAEHVHPDEIKHLEMLTWRQYIMQYVEKVDAGLRPLLLGKTTMMTQFRVMTAGVHNVAIILLAARGARSRGPQDAAVEMAAICDCLSMDIAKEALGILQGEKTEAVAGRNRVQLKRELRWLYIRCVEYLDTQPGAAFLRRYATGGYIFVPLMDRYRERARKGARTLMSSDLSRRVDEYRTLVPAKASSPVGAGQASLGGKTASGALSVWGIGPRLAVNLLGSFVCSFAVLLVLFVLSSEKENVLHALTRFPLI